MSTQQKISNHLESYERKDLLFKRWDLRPMSQAYYEAMYRKFPGNEKYFFELNPSFVYEYQSIDAMLGFPFVMLRDGYLGLTYFFLKYSKPPKNCETTFLVPAKFQDLVPEAWEDDILLYNFDYQSKLKSSKKLVLYGSIGYETFLTKKIDEKLLDLPEAKEYLLLSTLREWGFIQTHPEAQRYLNFQQELLKKANFNLKSFNEFRPDYFNFINSEYSFKNLDDDNFIIFDDYLTHYLSATGAANINDSKSPEVDIIDSFNLSPYHKINLGKPKSLSNNILKKKIDLKLKAIPLNPLSEVFYNYCVEQFLNEYKAAKK